MGVNKHRPPAGGRQSPQGVDALKVIPKGEVLPLEDKETRTLLIVAYSVEEVQFPEYSDPAWDTVIPARQFVALKILVTEENGVPVSRHYWIDSKRLIGALLPFLKRAGGLPRKYSISKEGIPPKSHYIVSFR